MLTGKWRWREGWQLQTLASGGAHAQGLDDDDFPVARTPVTLIEPKQE